MATISGASLEEIKKIKEFLTISNPIFGKRIQLGLANWGIPQQLKYYEYDKKTPNIINIPIGALPEILETGIICPKKEELIDLRLDKNDDVYFSTLNFTGNLRDYQQDILKSCNNKTLGVIESQTGSGKTVTFIGLINKLKKNTLILVNTLELVNQTKKAIIKFTNLEEKDIGFIGSGNFLIKPITIGLHQTMARLNEDDYKILNQTFSNIIADEVQIIAAKTYYETMCKLEAKYKWGFSATPKRTDGLTKVITFATGPKIHVVPKEKLKDHLIKPVLKIVYTDYYYPLLFSQEHVQMINDLANDPDRNKLIVETLFKNYKNNYVILLGSRKEQVYTLQKLLGKDAVSLTSSTKKKDRIKAIDDLNNKRKKYVVSTYNLFSTGIDIPHLDTLFLCSPIKSEILLKQSAGRLMRKAAGKNSATIIDFVDIKINKLKIDGKVREKLFNNL